MLLRFLQAQWNLLSLSMARLYRGLLFHLPGDSLPWTPEDDDAANSHVSGAEMQRDSIFFPPTERQIEDATREFVDSIDKAAVCNVASKHLDGGGRACHVVDEKRGGFNACFFIRFESDEQMWVFRIPLAPLVRDAWRKLQSEVTTMR